MLRFPALAAFLPHSPPAGLRETARAAAGAGLGIALTALVSTLLAGGHGALPLLIAPMGASAVLLFGVPASPLAQPWSIIGGNLVAGIIGVAAAHTIAAPGLAAAVAVALALAAMTVLRCVHPPSGAVALTAVLGGPQVAALGYGFVAVPVAINTLVLTLAALAYNNATGRSYPHRAHAPVHPHLPPAPLALSPADFDAVLADYGEPLDIDSDDLRMILGELLARARPAASAADL
ncbi:MAG TPA: HPP family protein [Novosphingobium sp.]|nr:HPP family protein [Novosphingobium sp.]HZV09600.1 HPP family protein [Novosphingobium sp.]